jgi:3-phosphoshikimate 1-carboxyvinyltransferase
MKLKVEPARRIVGRIVVPGDKSISHRAIMLGAIAKGKSSIAGFLNGADCLNTIKIFRQLGVEIAQVAATSYTVAGRGMELSKPNVAILDVGNSGTTIRLTTGLLAGQNFTSTISGDASIIKRPMNRVIQPLSQMGAQIFSENGFAPLQIIGSKLHGIDYQNSVASAQVKSAVLLAGLYADGTTTVTEPTRSRDHTEKLLRFYGAEIEVHDKMVMLKPTAQLMAQELAIPGDFSSAAFFIAAALLVPSSELLIENVGLNPTRTGFLDVIVQMNGKIELINQRFYGEEQVADILVRGSELQATKISGQLIPRMIDELPLIALLASQAEGESIVTDAAELRVKETDRIDTVASELAKLGIRLATKPDGFSVSGKQKIKSGSVVSHGDHRIAMMLAVAGLLAPNGIDLVGTEAIDISYPDFFTDLAKIVK